ncbi:glycosyltransferase [Marinobacter flavimaris]|uniref:glycosyltransferase n=1 Tax=Marinobacter flavimaris TaxID=262076 RepID=UPI00386B0C23
MGAAAPYLDDVRQLATELPFKATVSVNVTDMAGRMCLADLSVGAAGGASWERCCLGVPAVLVVLAENQVAGAVALEASGAAIKIESADQLGTTLPSVLVALSDPGRLERMSDAAAGITNGDGVFRAIQAMGAAGGRDR